MRSDATFLQRLRRIFRVRSGGEKVSAEQKKIHDFLNLRDGVLVLRQTHRPAANDPLATHRDFSGGSNLFTRQPARFDDLLPRSCADVPCEFIEADRVLLDELSI